MFFLIPISPPQGGHGGIEQMEARLAHNQEVAGSSPAAATKGHSLNQVNKDKPLQGVVLRNRTLLAVLCESLSRLNYSKPPTLVGRCIQRIVFIATKQTPNPEKSGYARDSRARPATVPP